MRTLASLALLLTATTASAGLFGDDCTHRAARNVAGPIAGVTRVVIVGRAGTLHVGGHRGGGEVRATGTACTSSAELLNQTKLTLSRSGSELRIEAEMPDSETMFDTAKLDFEVSVPDNVRLSIEDGSGALTIDNVGATDVIDGSGDLHIRNVAGDLSVHDGSGEMTIESVSGNVRVNDGSGDINIHDAGSVTIANDGSGGVDIRNIKGDVAIGNKGSGSVDVDGVGGNFRVANKGGGSINWNRVSGHVDVPERFRR
jgi:hypothetical protein